MTAMTDLNAVPEGTDADTGAPGWVREAHTRMVEGFGSGNGRAG